MNNEDAPSSPVSPSAPDPAPPVAGAGGDAKPAGLRAALFGAREMGVFLVIIGLCAALFFTGARDQFYSQSNFQNLTRQVALLAMFAIGEAIVLIIGGVDLSLGSLIAFSGVITGLLFTQVTAGMPFAQACAITILGTLAVSFLVGVFHASVVHFLKMPSFIVTLGTLSILRSQSQLYTRAVPIQLGDARYTPFTFLGNGLLFEGHPWAITVPVVILVVVVVIFEIVMRRGRIGRQVFAVGGNEEAARLSGVNLYKTKIFAYGSSAVLGGMAGILYAAYNRQGDPSAGIGYELNAVAAAVIGGCALTGGRGSIIGAVLGAVLLQVILSGINLLPSLSNPSWWEGTVVGTIVLLAVLFNVFRSDDKPASGR
jgi:ribose/xylose/arabinose/galactoside ABC-type transport system permease subunit